MTALEAIPMRADHTSFAKLIWQIADLLRGPTARRSTSRAVLPITVLRRFDCGLAETNAGADIRARTDGHARSAT